LKMKRKIMTPQNKRTTCVVCLRQAKKLIKNKFCSKECQREKKVKCDECGKINDSGDSIFCKKCKQKRINSNKKIMESKYQNEVAKKYSVLLPKYVL
jgi:hypothetical protein